MPQKKKPNRKKYTLLHRLGYKRVGFLVIGIGVVIGVLGGYIFWDEVNARSNIGWTYVGKASQFQNPGTDNSHSYSKQIVADVYACKEQVSDIDNPSVTYTVKARANVSSSTIDTNYGNPRLEVLSHATSKDRLAVSESITALAKRGEKLETPTTASSLNGKAIIYYGLNNFYQNKSGGAGLYAFGTVENLANCSLVGL